MNINSKLNLNVEIKPVDNCVAVYVDGERVDNVPTNVANKIINQAIRKVNVLVGDYVSAALGFVSELTIPSNIVEIGDDLLKGNGKLKKLVLSIGDTCVVGKRAFSGTGIKELVVPGSMQVVSNELFKACTQLEKVVFKEGVRVIQDSAFYGCIGLKSIEFPSTLEQVGYSFIHCPKLTKVEVPSTAQIGEEQNGKTLPAFDKGVEVKRVDYTTDPAFQV